MRACCFERFVDPNTRRPLAAYGWLRERQGHAGKFWVSIESNPYKFFRTREAARAYYEVMCDALRVRSKARRLAFRQKQLRMLAAVAASM